MQYKFEVFVCFCNRLAKLHWFHTHFLNETLNRDSLPNLYGKITKLYSLIRIRNLHNDTNFHIDIHRNLPRPGLCWKCNCIFSVRNFANHDSGSIFEQLEKGPAGQLCILTIGFFSGVIGWSFLHNFGLEPYIIVKNISGHTHN